MKLSSLFDDEFHELEDKIVDLAYGDICCEMQQPCRRHYQQKGDNQFPCDASFVLTWKCKHDQRIFDILMIESY